MNSTTKSNRLHISIFGRRNSGKSSLINAITQNDISLVSSVAGTTTDAIHKSIEIHGIGACTLVDTPGFDDIGELGEARIERTQRAINQSDIALLLCEDCDLMLEKEWSEKLKKQNIPIITIINKIDIRQNIEVLSCKIEEISGIKPLLISTKNGVDLEQIRESILRNLPEDYGNQTITGSLVCEGDTVMLVMPQDIQAPKGRLILPQVQTLRELLDKKCSVICTTTDTFSSTLKQLISPPKLIITDSQHFKKVYDLKPKESLLTSFSVLMAGYKGEIKCFIEGAKAIDSLTETSKVLIAEACVHIPIGEDIGRVQIPNLLRKKVGEKLQIDTVSGRDFAEKNLSDYSLIIHCGGCMFNRKYMLSRVEKARELNIPITNYGVTIAHIQGILDCVVY
ncbi:MAG: [FeFe] hydrogenase H-cluster maturation GTPase HydF [Rikenellaceae bacterium]